MALSVLVRDMRIGGGTIADDHSFHPWRWTSDTTSAGDLLHDMGGSGDVGDNLGEGFHPYGLERRPGRVIPYCDGAVHRGISPRVLKNHPEFADQPRPLTMTRNGHGPTPPRAESQMEVVEVAVAK